MAYERRQTSNQSGSISRTLFWLIAASVLVGAGFAYQENTYARSAFEKIVVERQYADLKLDLFPSQSIKKEDPDPEEESRRRRDHGPHTQSVYVVRGRFGSSIIRIGVGYEGRIIWKTASNLVSH